MLSCYDELVAFADSHNSAYYFGKEEPALDQNAVKAGDIWISDYGPNCLHIFDGNSWNTAVINDWQKLFMCV